MLEVFTVGGGEYLVNTFNAVAAWAGGGGYRSLLRVVMVMGLIYSLLVVAFTLNFRAWLNWFLQATGKGAEVHLLLSGRSDHPLVHLAQQSYYSELLSAGAVIHLFQPGFLHAKHMSIDEAVAVVGSSNVDMRSFALNSEISLVLYDREATLRALRPIRRRDILQSKRGGTL